MADFDDLGLKAGIWSGLVHGGAAPTHVVLVHQGEVVSAARVSPVSDGTWQIDADLPVGRIGDGVTSFLLLSDHDGADGGTRLASLSLVAGKPVEQDLLIELDLLRAELELLKREFRRFAAG